MMSWVEQVVEALSECKGARVPFEHAWLIAVQAHPPRLRELGVRDAGTLFNQTEGDTLEWFRGVCEAAYDDAPRADGSPSRLRGLRVALETVGSEERQPAPRSPSRTARGSMLAA